MPQAVRAPPLPPQPLARPYERVAMTDHTIRSVASITREGRAPQPHACDAPNLSAKEFLLAVMHDRTLPLATRIKAASALLPFTNSVPRPTNSVPRCKIVIGGLKPYNMDLSPRTPSRSTRFHSQNREFAQIAISHHRRPHPPYIPRRLLIPKP